MKKDYKIVESIHGTFFYHLSEDLTPICDKNVLAMRTRLPLETWGLETHIGERYCKKCDVILKEAKNQGKTKT